eukprot:2069263-Lingulodinium_polyedra.AAC.1
MPGAVRRCTEALRAHRRCCASVRPGSHGRALHRRACCAAWRCGRGWPRSSRRRSGQRREGPGSPPCWRLTR